MRLQSYSQRLLNPFRGIQRVMRLGAAEAVSLDGDRWDLYVSNDELLQGLPPGCHALVSDIRFGRWTPDAGLTRGPIYPSEDFRRMERLGWALFHQLEQLHDQPVFPFLDRLELWLLDRQGGLLALLDSVIRADDMDLEASLTWRAGMDDTADSPEDRVGRSMEQTIRARAGERPRAVWLRREEDGGMHPLHWLGGAGADVPAWRQPAPELVSPTVAEPELLRVYLAWLAPWLLLLPQPEARRRALEIQARQRAEEVDRLHRLYPDAVDPRMLQAARVEAMLKRAQPNPSHAESVLSTFYIELEEGAV